MRASLSPLLACAKFVLTAFLLVGCATRFADLKDVPNAIAENRAKALLEAISQEKFPKGDQVVLHLERGSLLEQIGRYDDSFNAFEQAKDFMDEFYTIKLTESNYRGTELERAQALNAQLLSAMAGRDPGKAAVIARQIDVFMSQQGEDSMFSCLPLSWYLASIALAANREYDNAKVVARRIPECFADKLFKVPEGELPMTASGSDKAEVWLVVGEGFVGKKVEKVESLPWRFASAKYAWPVYREVSPPELARVSFSAAGVGSQAVLVQDLEPLVRKKIDSEGATIKALSIAKAVAAVAVAEAAYRAQVKDERKASAGTIFLAQLNVVGIIAASNALVTVDQRSWRSMPRRWWVAKLSLPPGQQTVDVEMFNDKNVVKQYQTTINLKAGEVAVVFQRFVRPVSRDDR